jgi:SSS family transporter
MEEGLADRLRIGDEGGAADVATRGGTLAAAAVRPMDLPGCRDGDVEIRAGARHTSSFFLHACRDVSMRPIDYLVVAAYAACMLAIGWYYGRRTGTVDEFLLGGRRMNPVMIGLSLFATLTSTLSYLALPGEVIKNGPMVLALYASFPLVMPIVGWWLIPAIMRQRDVTSGYELLERRLGRTGRLLGAAMFISLRMIWMASILYATSDKVIVPLFGIDHGWTPLVCVALGVLTIIYTSEGGMRAVVATDALQAVIMFAGAIATIAVVTISLGGIARWWPTGWSPQWPEPVFGFRSDVRMTFCNAVLNMFVWMTCTAGSDQMAIQRYLSTRDVQAARRSFGINLVVNVLMVLLLTAVGLALLGYFTAHPESFGPDVSLVEAADELFPRFIVSVMPGGLAGIVIAAILSAAMSSLSSGINSTSAVIVGDFIGLRRATPLTDHEQLRLAKGLSVAIGIVAICGSMIVPFLATNLYELCIKAVDLLTAPLFVLFFLALFVPWATPAGGVASAVASISVAVAISFFQLFDLAMLWSAPCSLIVGIAAGMIVSLLFPARPAS